jgi:hypothetical protein
VEEGDAKAVDVLVGEMAHLPKERDFAASAEAMAKMFRSNKALRENEPLTQGARRLALMGKRLLGDRQNLKPVLEGVREVLAEWNAWAQEDDPTEEEIQRHLEQVAGAMLTLRESLSAYDASVLEKLKEPPGA